MNPKTKQVQKIRDGVWAVNLFFGGKFVRRSYYSTRAAARDGDISDKPGERDCIALTREGLTFRKGENR